jgi:hypothetical protein
MIMDAATRHLVSERWNSYGLDKIERALCPDDWSGQGARAFARKRKSGADTTP